MKNSVNSLLKNVPSSRGRVRVSKLDEIEEENYVTQRDVIRELSS